MISHVSLTAEILCFKIMEHMIENKCVYSYYDNLLIRLVKSLQLLFFYNASCIVKTVLVIKWKRSKSTSLSKKQNKKGIYWLIQLGSPRDGSNSQAWLDTEAQVFPSLSPLHSLPRFPLSFLPSYHLSLFYFPLYFSHSLYKQPSP